MKKTGMMGALITAFVIVLAFVFAGALVQTALALLGFALSLLSFFVKLMFSKFGVAVLVVAAVIYIANNTKNERKSARSYDY